MSEDKEHEEAVRPKKAWEDIIFKAIQTLATAPQKIKDPKETVGAAIEWVNSTRQDVQDKFVGDLSDKMSKVNWDIISKQVADHIATKYDIEITSRVSLKPKADTAPIKDEEEEQTIVIENRPQ